MILRQRVCVKKSSGGGRVSWVEILFVVVQKRSKQKVKSILKKPKGRALR